MSDELLVRHCAPTLAGLKTGNMFSYLYSSKEEVMGSVNALNRILTRKGICVLPLRFYGGRVLIYVYRPARLMQDLSSSVARKILAERGYSYNKPHQCLLELIQKLRGGDDFPHEIGLFLGYPPEDVDGFITNSAQDYKIVGTWKVYGDVSAAERIFSLYRKCSRIYHEQWKKGKSIERLAVAG